MLKRALTGVTVAMIASLAAPLMSAAPAFANGVLQGAATIKTAGGGANLQSGDGATTWTLRLPAGAACAGDSPNDGWRWQTYMVPSSVDPSTLTFGSTGPLPLGTGASFRQPLYDTSGNPVVNQQTPAASPAPGPGPIVNIPDVNFQVFTPGQIPAGVYNLGIACTLNGPSATQMDRYWNVQMTVSTPGGGNAQVAWQNGTTPIAPAATTVTSGDGQVQVAFTQGAGSNPAITGYTATATPSGGGAAITGTGASSPITISGLTNLTTYNITIHSTNAVGNSAESNQVSGTPGKPAVTGLAATPSPNTVSLTWNAPASPPASYSVDYCSGDMTASGAGNNNGVCDSGDGAAFVATTPTSTPSASISGLTPGQLYTFTVYYPQSFKSSITATPLSNSILLQDVTVTRPNGALVLTQVCGQYGALPSEPASPGFGAFAAQPAGTAAGGATGPFTDNGSGAPTTTTDPNYPSQYPNPANPTYPTHCSLDLGTASLVTSGAGAGQFFAASGRLNQVTVVDSRDTDPGWTVSATMGTFSAGAGKTFSGNQLGWTNTSTDTAPFTDAGTPPRTYDQTVINDPAVAPNTAGGAGSSHPVAHAASGAGLGVATIDARIKLLIPIFARNGAYTGTLTITAA